MNSKLSLLPAFIGILLISLSPRTSAAERLDVTKDTDFARLIPISLRGFTGEVLEVLKFDLSVMGFDVVTQEAAQYHVEGNNRNSIEARLSDRVTKSQLFSFRYEDGTSRSQAHALSDDIVLKITGKPGIAQTKIAFRIKQGKNSEIYRADYDGANAIPLTNDQTTNIAPAWTPGQSIVYYTSYKSGFPDIYYYNLKTGQRRIIAQHPGLNTSAAVSPNGNRVAMILSKDGNPELYVANADGTGLKRLTKTPGTESSPCWSPDGRTICVVSKDGLPGLFLIPADGGAMRRLPTIGTARATEPDWSPDGKSIVFTAQWSKFAICVIPATGGQIEQLVEGEDPSWAPNSRTVIFTRQKSGRSVLSLLDVPTKRVKDVGQISGSVSQPAWAR